MADLTVARLGLTFRTPVVLASGPAGFGAELGEGLGWASVGALTTKTVTDAPRCGNPQPRLLEATGGAINAIGLENPGIDRFLEEILADVLALPTRRIISLAASTPEGLAALIERLDDVEGVDLIEINLSCPNVEGGVIGRSPEAVRRFIGAACGERATPILAKLAGDAGDTVALCEAALHAGAAGLVLINTVRAMRIDRRTGVPFLHRAYGGLSGPAILPIALARVYEARRAFPDALIVGTGGITDLDSLLEMEMAGADLVGIGLGIMIDPGLPERLAGELATWLEARGMDSVEEVVGCAHRGGIGVSGQAARC